MSVQLHTPATGERRVIGSIELRSLSATEWRISDSTIAAGEPGSILGFAERVEGGAFDVLQLGHGHGIGRLRFDSLQSVVEHFSRLL